MLENTQPFTAHTFQQFLDQGLLKGSRCQDCQQVYLPVRALCPHCGQTNLEWVEFSGKGTLVAFTSVYISPTFMIEAGFGRDAPYLTGVVELEDGPRISARILGLDAENPTAVEIGTPLQFTVVEIGTDQDAFSQLAFSVVG